VRAAERTLGLRRPSVPSTPRPIVLTDWSARLASDWTHIADRWDNAADALAREFTRLSGACEYAPRVLVAPLLSELAELKAVTIVDWRQALRVHAEDELALIDAEMAVAL
jgi:kynureninase